MSWINRLLAKLHFNTIRKQLLLIFVLITFLPILSASIGSFIVGYSNGKQTVVDQLESLLLLKEQKISGWYDNMVRELSDALDQEYIYDRIAVVLDLTNENYYLEYYFKSVRYRMQRFLLNAQYFTEISLLDLDGDVVLSTNVDQEGMNYADTTFFTSGLNGRTIQFTTLPDDPSTMIVMTVLPVQNDQGQVIGLFAGKANMDKLHEIVVNSLGLGRTGKAFLSNQHGILVSTTDRAVQQPDQLSVKQFEIIQQQRSGISYYNDERGVRVVGAYVWLPRIASTLFIEKDLTEVFGVILETMKVNLVVMMIAVVIAVIASLLITRRIADPIMELSERADGIARGDWSPISHTDRRDELGVLARALDSMMQQLRELITNLELRIQRRTQQLQDANQALLEANQAIHRRALQLETSASISREITSILEPDELFQRVTQQIRVTFGFNAVNIFLTDPQRCRLILIANSYDVTDKQRSLEIPIDSTSLNGWAAMRNEPIMANDVIQVSMFQFDEMLPDIQAELVIPLRIAGRLIGTLDMETFNQNAFSPEDLPVFQALGDQIAIAIENSRLYENNKQLAVLEERNRLARELHDSVIQSLYSLTLLEGGWKRFSAQEKAASSDEFMDEFSEIARRALKEMRLLVYNLRPPVLEQEGLVVALHARLDAVEKRAGIETRLLADDLSNLDMATQEGIYRIAQEALNNTLKHADASHVILQLSIQEKTFLMTLQDDGKGIQPDSLLYQRGMGLTSMRERAEKMGGVLDILSSPGKGTTITLRVPLGCENPSVYQVGEKT